MGALFFYSVLKIIPDMHHYRSGDVWIGIRFIIFRQWRNIAVAWNEYGSGCDQLVSTHISSCQFSVDPSVKSAITPSLQLFAESLLSANKA